MPNTFSVMGWTLFLLDTGAAFSVIEKTFFDSCPLKERIDIQTSDLTAHATHMPILGKLSLYIYIDNTSY